METNLSNTASVLGEYNSISTQINSEDLVVVMISGLTVKKTADKMVWGDGKLTYTIEVDNQTNVDYTNPVITDKLDTTLITFVAGSVKLNGTELDASKYTYDDSTGLLTINIETVASMQKSTITFEVEKKNA